MVCSLLSLATYAANKGTCRTVIYNAMQLLKNTRNHPTFPPPTLRSSAIPSLQPIQLIATDKSSHLATVTTISTQHPAYERLLIAFLIMWLGR